MLKQSHKHQIFEHFHHLGNTVDWFSNPKEPPWDLFKTLWKNRISTTNLNWLAGFLPSSSINSSTAPHISWAPSRVSPTAGRVLGKWSSMEALLPRHLGSPAVKRVTRRLRGRWVDWKRAFFFLKEDQKRNKISLKSNCFQTSKAKVLKLWFHQVLNIEVSSAPLSNHWLLGTPRLGSMGSVAAVGTPEHKKPMVV